MKSRTRRMLARRRRKRRVPMDLTPWIVAAPWSTRKAVIHSSYCGPTISYDGIEIVWDR